MEENILSRLLENIHLMIIVKKTIEGRWDIESTIVVIQTEKTEQWTVTGEKHTKTADWGKEMIEAENELGMNDDLKVNFIKLYKNI